jgi:hypothetical protein
MNDGGKGDKQRPTDHKKWSSGYDNIQWTKEEDEEFNRIQNRTSTERPVALPDIEGQKNKTS